MKPKYTRPLAKWFTVYFCLRQSHSNCSKTSLSPLYISWCHVSSNVVFLWIFLFIYPAPSWWQDGTAGWAGWWGLCASPPGPQEPGPRTRGYLWDCTCLQMVSRMGNGGKIPGRAVIKLCRERRMAFRAWEVMSGCLQRETALMASQLLATATLHPS